MQSPVQLPGQSPRQSPMQSPVQSLVQSPVQPQGSRAVVGLLSSMLMSSLGMKGDTFNSLYFLDQILSGQFLSKIPNLFGGEN